MRIVTYHRVADPAATPDLDPSLVSATPDGFRAQMQHLRRSYEPVSMSDVLRALLEERKLPPRAVLVTFDDAYRDVAEHAWPVVRTLGIPITIFVPTGYPGQRGRWFWWDRLHKARRRLGETAWREAVLATAAEEGISTEGAAAAGDLRRFLRHLPHDRTEGVVDRVCERAGFDPAACGPPTVLRWDELREMGDRGVEFGAHTVSHAALACVDDGRLRREIRESLADVERELGVRGRTLAYPYGVTDERVARAAAAEGCVAAFTTEDGLNRLDGRNRFRLRRTNITRRTTPTLFRLRMLPWFAAVDRWRHGPALATPSGVEA